MMENKVYVPVLSDEDHLLQSKENANRVRGLTRNKENKNPDIPEWEEYDLDELLDERSRELRRSEGAETSVLKQELAHAVAIIVAKVSISVLEGYVIPWVAGTALPWIKERSADFFSRFKKEEPKKEEIDEKKVVEFKNKAEKLNKKEKSESVQKNESATQEDVA